MIQIDTNLVEGRLPLGQLLDIRLHYSDSAVETRFFLKHKPVFYLKPLTPWESRDSLMLMPESLGEFSLQVAWRTSDGATGWHEPIDFEVIFQNKVSPCPFKIRSPGNSVIWAPSEWEAIVTAIGEEPTLEAVRKLLRPGDVAYDIGANLGKYAIPMARLAGPEGFLYCFEANPVCVQFLRSNLIENGITNAEILPVAVLDRDGETRFTINYGNVAIGLTDVGNFYSIKAGHEIMVFTSTLDDLIRTYGLRPPDLVKMDIEGAEQLAVHGMRKTLEEHRPILVLEIHGVVCSSTTLEQLDQLEYVYRDPGSDTAFTNRDEVCAYFDESAVFQLVALPAAAADESP